MRISIGALSLLFLTVGAAAAHAHASLAHASPSVGSTVSAAPHEVILTFTERLEAAFSNLTVVDARGASQRQHNAYQSQVFECGNLQGELACAVDRHP
jgi:methionine-rich copper-binding protein CopC